MFGNCCLLAVSLYLSLWSASPKERYPTREGVNGMAFARRARNTNARRIFPLRAQVLAGAGKSQFGGRSLSLSLSNCPLRNSTVKLGMLQPEECSSEKEQALLNAILLQPANRTYSIRKNIGPTSEQHVSVNAHSLRKLKALRMRAVCAANTLSRFGTVEGCGRTTGRLFVCRKDK